MGYAMSGYKNRLWKKSWKLVELPSRNLKITKRCFLKISKPSFGQIGARIKDVHYSKTVAPVCFIFSQHTLIQVLFRKASDWTVGPPWNFGISLDPDAQWSTSSQVLRKEEFFENLSKNGVKTSKNKKLSLF